MSWYSPGLGDVPDHFRQLLEGYSDIRPEDVKPHILEVRTRAWEIRPSPTIGLCCFLDLDVAWSSAYDSVISRLRSQPQDGKHGGEVLLEVGCCFGQNIRKIVWDGVSPDRVVGLAFVSQFIELGYDLFRDRDRLESCFIVWNPVHCAPRQDIERRIERKVDMIYIGAYMHLFPYEMQVSVCRDLVRLLRPLKSAETRAPAEDVGRSVGQCRSADNSQVSSEPYSNQLIFGRQVGFLARAGHYKHPDLMVLSPVFYHSPTTFREMWARVGRETGTRWNVTIRTEMISPPAGRWTFENPADAEVRWLVFVAERRDQ